MKSGPASLVSMSICLVTTVALATVAVGGQPTKQYYYSVGKNRVPLTLDSKRVAILEEATVDTTDPSVASVMAGAVGLSDVSTNIRPGWAVARTAGVDLSAETTETMVSRLADTMPVDFVSPVFLQPNGLPLWITPNVIVAFRADVPLAQRQALLDEYISGTIVTEDFGDMPDVYYLRSPSQNGFDVLAQVNALAGRPEVLYAESDAIFTGRSTLTPNDSLYPQQWGLHNIGQTGGTADMDLDAPEAWDTTTGDADIIVLIMDSGVQQNHTDINQVPGNSFAGSSTNGNPFNQCDNHGTAVAGCATAVINNGTGVTGIAPACKSAGAYVAISQIPCSDMITINPGSMIAALTWGESIGARVTNASLSIGDSSSLRAKYAQTYFESGMVHFAGSGNSGQGDVGFPAGFPTVIAVGAVTHTGGRASFSTFGAGLELMAPGVSIWTTDRTGTAGYSNGNWTVIQGTSFASPLAAGVAALLLSVDDTLTSDEVRTILQQSAKDRGTSGFDQFYGYGIVQARDAIDYYFNPPPVPGAFSTTFPANEATDAFLTPFFQWEIAPDALTYTIVVDDDDNFVNPEINETTGLNQYVSLSALVPGRTYYWRVTAHNDNGSTQASPGVVSFTTMSDCNGNNIADAQEILDGTVDDCNMNGVPDACDFQTEINIASQDMTPIAFETPQSLVIDPARTATSDVTLDFAARSDINFTTEFMNVLLNGNSVGTIYVSGFGDCATASLDSLVVPAATWNANIVDGAMTVTVAPSDEVGDICNEPSYLRIEVEYIGAPTSLDLNANEIPDECENTLCGDSNCDGAVSVGDINYFVTAITGGEAAWDALAGTDCSFIDANDTNDDGTVSVGDINNFVTAVTSGSCP